jgi:hypothetical protein
MSHPDDVRPNNNYYSPSDPYYGQTESPPTWVASEWFFSGIPQPPDSLSLYTPNMNIAGKSLDILGTQANNPFSTVIPLPSTVSGADLNINFPSTMQTRKMTQASTNAASGNHSLLLNRITETHNRANPQPARYNAANDLSFLPKPTYKPGWATASGRNTTDTSSASTPQSRKRLKSSSSSVKTRTSPRTAPSPRRSDLGDELSAGEETDPNLASKSKRSHNLTEKKYRTRLNGYFETLLAAIPRPSGAAAEPAATAGDAPEKKISKGEVLVLAMEYIRELEREQSELEEQRRLLSGNMEQLKGLSGMETRGGVAGQARQDAQ